MLCCIISKYKLGGTEQEPALYHRVSRLRTRRMWTAALFLRASTSSPSVCGWELCLRCVSCSDILEFLVLACALSSWEQLGCFHRGSGASSCNLWIKYLYLIVPSCYNEFNDHTVAKENNSHYSSLYNSAILNSFNFRENISLLKASNTYRVYLRKKNCSCCRAVCISCIDPL